MLDIKFIRENPKLVKEACKNKGIKIDIDRFLDLDKKRRELLQALEDMRAEKNKANKEIQQAESEKEKEVIILKMRELDNNSDRVSDDFKKIDKEFNGLVLEIPNIPSEDTPIGPDESANQEISRWGNIPKFNFPIKNHIQLGKELDLIDIEKGSKTAGFRGYYLKNEAVLIQMALMWHTLLKLKKGGFQLMIPPTLVRKFVLTGSGHFPAGKDEVFQVANPGRLADGKKSLNQYT